MEDGYEFFAKRQLVTLFSAPNYCGEFDNAGGMMSVDETLMCSFQVSQWVGSRVQTFFLMSDVPPSDAKLFPFYLISCKSAKPCRSCPKMAYMGSTAAAVLAQRPVEPDRMCGTLGKHFLNKFPPQTV